MAYNADNSGVTALTGVTYSASTVPTSIQVTNFRGQRYAEINSVLKARGYNVPASGESDVALLSHYEDLGAAILAEQARYQGNVEQPRVQEWHEEYMAFLNRLRQGQQDLIDQSAEGDLEPYWTSAPAVRRDDYFRPEEAEG
jgi:hypothetical protein